jgi:hypothetical protein
MADEAEQAAVAPTPTVPVTDVLDTQLFMAARRGDGEQLAKLLKDLDQQGDPAERTAAAATATTTGQQFVVQVDRPRAAPSLHLLDGVTRSEGDTLLHVVAACGDGDNFLHCAEMIYQGRSALLHAHNNEVSTPLHCAARAGNANMISRITELVKDEAAGDETKVTEFLRMQNKLGETALHQAVRAGSRASVDKLMSVDSELASVPPPEAGNTTSPLYLAISLGKEDIAAHLIHKTKGKLSCHGPHGRNVLHAAVTRRKGTICLNFGYLYRKI